MSSEDFNSVDQLTENLSDESQTSEEFYDDDIPGPERDMRVLQETAYQNSRAKGFHDHGDKIRDQIARLLIRQAEVKVPRVLSEIQSDLEFWEQILLEHAGNRLMLISGESSEAHEELRAGHGVGEIYFKEGKPEGAPIECADIVIRVLDFAGENDFDLAEAIAIKMDFNAGRPAMHGKRF